MGSGYALCPKAIIPTFPSGSLWPLLPSPFGALLSCGYSKVHCDWPLLSLAAAFLTSGNTEKPVNCWNGSHGDSQLVLECSANGKATDCWWRAVAVCELGPCFGQGGAGSCWGWHKDCSSHASTDLCQGRWAVAEDVAHLCFVPEHKKNSRMRDMVPEVLFLPSKHAFLWLSSPAATPSLGKTAF